MTTHTLVLERKPKVKERPRLGRRRKAYTPEATLEWEAALAAAWRASGGPKFEGPLKVETEFHKDHVVVTVTELDEEQRSKLRGDIDNYIKIIYDGLNDVAYLDDKQIVMTVAHKAY